MAEREKTLAEMTVRERAETAIREGGSAFVRVGREVRHITSLKDIPSEAELAQANPDYAQEALKAIQAQMAALASQAALIQQSTSKEEESKEVPGAKSAKASVKDNASAKPSNPTATGSTSSETSNKGE